VYLPIELLPFAETEQVRGPKAHPTLFDAGIDELKLIVYGLPGIGAFPWEDLDGNSTG
jgi:hypothetical protein